MMTTYILALAIGVVAGMRAMTAPAAMSWAAWLGKVDLSQGMLAFAGFRFSPWIFSLLAIGELITDQLPSTPSRKVTPQFLTRLLSGGLCGSVLGIEPGFVVEMFGVGVAGAAIGTLGGAAARAKMAAVFGSDRPAAIIEDIVAIGGAVLIVAQL